IDLATGNKITGQTVAMNFAFNTFTNGSGSFSSKKGMKADVNTSKLKAGDVNRTPKVEIQFSRNSKHDADEFSRQLKNQQDGMNKLTVEDYIKNRGDYLANGRSSAGNAAQQAARDNAYNNKVVELLSNGAVDSLEEAERQAKNWLSTQNALHDPDQIAGGFAKNVTGVGDANINKAIGSKWKTRIGAVDEVVDEIVRTTPYEDLSKIYLNVTLIP
ncbi:TPA: hypothetical protein U1C23_002305, partial [Streptococcus suis]|nr:hypothetical protein [Streptococcus suis]